jgi:hypothetical protein
MAVRSCSRKREMPKELGGKLVRDAHVAALDVAVYEVSLMAVAQRAGHVHGKAQQARQRGPVRLDELLQVALLGVLHQDARRDRGAQLRGNVVADAKDLDDVGVLELVHDLQLPRDGLRVRNRGQYLDGNGYAHPLAQVHAARGTTPQLHGRRAEAHVLEVDLRQLAARGLRSAAPAPAHRYCRHLASLLLACVHMFVCLPTVCGCGRSVALLCSPRGRPLFPCLHLPPPPRLCDC